MTEKRYAPRKQIFLKAQAIGPGEPPIDCLVCDLSESGARLQPADGVAASGFPERFDLFVPRSGMRRAARVAWRSATELGVAFETAPAP